MTIRGWRAFWYCRYNYTTASGTRSGFTGGDFCDTKSWLATKSFFVRCPSGYRAEGTIALARGKLLGEGKDNPVNCAIQIAR